VRIAVQLVVSGGVIAFLLWQLDLRRTFELVGESDVRQVVAALGIFLATTWVMAWRWGVRGTVGGRLGARAARFGLTTWAVVVCAVTIVVSIGGPLVGRGVFVGVNLIRNELPWRADRPSDELYRLPPLHDTVELGVPQRTLIRDTLFDEGRLPLWEPYANGGTPLASQPNTGIFSPVNWPLLLLGVKLGTAWAGLLRLALAAGGTFLLLRRLGLSRFTSVCGGFVYCTSGFIISWNNWPQADLAALMPWLFLVADRVRERRTPLDVAALAVVVASMLFAGYPPLMIATFYALAGFLVVRWWEATRWADGPTVGERLRAAVKPALLVAGGVALGVALVAFQLLPFLARVGVYDTAYRAESGDRNLPEMALLTSVLPWGQGSPAHPGTAIPVDHVTNFSIIEQFVFLGAAAMVFLLLVLVFGRPRSVTAGAYRYSIAVMVLLLMVLFGVSLGPLAIGQWTKDALYALPGVSQIPLHRWISVLLFFAALLSAFGIEQCLTADRSSWHLTRSVLVRGAVLLVAGAYFFVPAVRSEAQLTRDTTEYVAFNVTHEVAQRLFILRSAIVPALIALTTVLLVVVVVRGHQTWRRVAIGAIPVLLAVEGLMVTSVMLPRVSEADYYPETGSIRYLQAHLGHERIAPSRRVLYFGTNAMYRLRSVGGHSFVLPEWRELFDVFGDPDNPPTQLRIPARDLDRIASPALDRLAARFYVTSPFEVHGRRDRAPAATTTVAVGNGRTAEGRIAGGPLRGVSVVAEGSGPVRGTAAYLEVTVRDARGREVATGSQRYVSYAFRRKRLVPVAAEDAPDDGRFTVEVALVSDAPDRARLAAYADGSLAVSAVRPVEDGLRLVHADAGAAVYRRLDALPRIRWAADAIVEPRAKARIRMLADGRVPDDTVVLDRPGPGASGKPARVVVTKDGVDSIRARVDAEGAGYLVVADAIRDGWKATVDGREVALRNADHALVAIPVSAGRHTVALRAAPRGWRAGIAVSLLALVVLLALVGWGLVRRASRRLRFVPPVEEGSPQLEPEKVDSK
jgi:membrane protein YfhO